VAARFPSVLIYEQESIGQAWPARASACWVHNGAHRGLKYRRVIRLEASSVAAVVSRLRKAQSEASHFARSTSTLLYFVSAQDGGRGYSETASTMPNPHQPRDVARFTVT